MRTLQDFQDLVDRDQGRAVITTQRADGTMQSSVVNAGVLDHPVTGEPVVACVVLGDSLKVRLLRDRPVVTMLIRVEWEWIAVEGLAELVGPDDELSGVDAAGKAVLFRDIFRAAGGTHDDWDDYDRTMVDEGRVAVFVPPDRIYGVLG